MDKIIKEIIKKRKEVIFLSPHFDDAALSCGGLIENLIKRKVKVRIINAFTKSHKGPYTLSARKFLKISGNFKDATQFYKSRENEDLDALRFIGVKKIINLGFCDALFRKKTNTNFLGKILPEFSHFYPAFQFFITGKIAKGDNSEEQLIKKIKKFDIQNEVLFIPLAVGNHVDHQITRNAGRKISDSIIYYSDFPYNTRSAIPKEFTRGLEKVSFKINLKKKNEMLKKYKTQFSGLFPKGKIPAHNEVYFTKNNLKI